MIEISQQPARKLLGLSANFIGATHVGANGPQIIGPLWGRVSQLFFARPELEDTNPIGIGAMWPVSGGQIGEMTYFAGYEIDTVPKDLAGLELLELETGKYAQVTHIGPMSSLPATVVDFYSKLPNEASITRRQGIDLEIYLQVGEVSKVVIAAPIFAGSRARD